MYSKVQHCISKHRMRNWFRRIEITLNWSGCILYIQFRCAAPIILFKPFTQTIPCIVIQIYFMYVAHHQNLIDSTHCHHYYQQWLYKVFCDFHKLNSSSNVRLLLCACIFCVKLQLINGMYSFWCIENYAIYTSFQPLPTYKSLKHALFRSFYVK